MQDAQDETALTAAVAEVAWAMEDAVTGHAEWADGDDPAAALDDVIQEAADRWGVDAYTVRRLVRDCPIAPQFYTLYPAADDGV